MKRFISILTLLCLFSVLAFARKSGSHHNLNTNDFAFLNGLVGIFTGYLLFWTVPK